jgi:hypothetical protein
MSKTKFSYALGLVPLLLAADNYGTSREAVIVNTLPMCSTGQYLVYQGGGVVCQTISGGTLSLPNCSSQGQILTSISSGDAGGGLACTTKGMPSLSSSDITTIDNMETTITMLGTELTQIQNTPPGSASVYVGASTNPYTGAQGTGSGDGPSPGIAGAASICSQQYGTGAHVCTVYDMYFSAATIGQNPNNKLSATTQITTQQWVYSANWQPPIAGAQQPDAGLADNCGGFTYPTGDRVWKGTQFVWETIAETSQIGLKFFGGTSAACSSTAPYACCK